MNAAEKKILKIALLLFVVGIVVRFLPWGLPSIEQVEESSKPEYIAEVLKEMENSPPEPDKNTYKLSKRDGPKTQVAKTGKRKKSKSSSKRRKMVHFPIGINSAGVDELCALKGVGPKLAEKIIAFREQHGPLRSATDLQKVPGIGKKKAEGILQSIIFD